MSSGLDRFIEKQALLMLEVQDLRREVEALRALLRERDGEAAALQTMLVAWPPAEAPVHH